MDHSSGSTDRGGGSGAHSRPRPGCPPEAVHRAFLLGNLPADTSDAIAGHLDGCPACEERSQRLDAEADQVVAALRGRSAYPSTADGYARSAAGDTLPAGRLYVPGYELLGEVGRGGMGVVYQARQLGLNRSVALKMILAGPFARPEELVRFHVEGELLARLAHPSIVRVYEIGHADGRPYLAMEWVDGGNLADRLAGAAGEPRVGAALVEQLARAVQYAHDRGIIHRDLKPANILLQRPEAGTRETGGGSTPPSTPGTPGTDLCPKITDFGLARSVGGVSDLTAPGVILGTPGYMAPEQARGDPLVGPAADVYSLGAILYEWLTGRPPFPLPAPAGPGDSHPAAVLAQVLDRPPVSPRRLAPRVSRDLATVCLRCLEKNPAARYPTAAALADDLRRFLNGEAIRARPTGELERVWKWARRRPVVAGLITAVAASLTVGTGVSTYFAVTAARESAAATRARNESQRQLARSDFKEGVRLAELGRVGDGLHWMLAALREAPDEPADRAFRDVVGMNLGAWLPRLHRQRFLIELPDDVYALAFSPDGRMFAAGGHDRTVRLFYTDTGEPAGPPLAAGARVRALAFSPDGRWLVAGGDAGYQQGEKSALSRWEVAGRAPADPTDRLVNREVKAIAFSCDGKTFAVVAKPVSAEPADVCVFDCATGRPLGRSPAPATTDRYLLAPRTRGPGFVLAAYAVDAPVWVAGADGESVSTWVRVDTARSDYALCLRAGDRLSVTDGTGSRAYDLPSGAVAADVSLSAEGSWFAQSPDGRLRASGASNRDLDVVSGQVRLWDAPSGTTQALVGTDDVYQAMTFSPDGRRLLIACRGGRIKLWDLAPPVLRQPEPTRPDARRAAGRIRFADAVFSRDRSTVALASATAGVARVWRADPLPGRDLPQYSPVFTGRGHQVGLSPDGRHAFTLTREGVCGWEVDTGRPLDRPFTLPLRPSALAVDPTGRTLAAGDFGRHVRLLDVATGRQLGPTLRQTDIVFAAEFSPDGRYMAVSTTKDWKRVFGVRLWEVGTGRQVGDLMVAGGMSPARLAFTPDGTRLITVSSAGVRQWDTGTGEQIGAVVPHTGDASVVAVRPDGLRFMTGSRTGVLSFRDTATGEPVGPVVACPAAVTALECDPAGRMAVAGCADGTTRLWDTFTGHPVGPAVVQADRILAVAFLPDGRNFRTVAADGSVRDGSLAEPFRGDPADLERDLIAWTGVRLGAGKVLTPVDPSDWNAARRGSPEPVADSAWEAGLADDAEQTGDPASARWHLDRLIARDPNNWLLFARRGRAFVDLGLTAEAEHDFDRASALAPKGVLPLWCAQRATDCQAAGRAGTARWYLDRMAPE
jgi:serine/threonine protein kinase/WD40 repeat protein